MKAIFGAGQWNRTEGEKYSLAVISCGSYRDVDQQLETVRMNGTLDYHLLFSVHGVIESEGRKCTDNEYILFLPGEKQEYRYCVGAGTLYYWIHFVGTEGGPFFEGEKGRKFDYTAHSVEINTLLSMLVNAVTNKEDYKAGYAETLLRAVLTVLTSKKTTKRFGKVLKMMRDFTKGYTLTDYAEACNMSDGHFIRMFKEETGNSPMAYRTHLQIEHSKQLLLRTALKISAVAELSGFSDAMYFSRVFKKETGLSPVKYRQNFI